MRLIPTPTPRPLLRSVQERHPGFLEAVRADARLARRDRDVPEPTSLLGECSDILRRVGSDDAFGALVLYRLRARCQRAGIPVVPRIAHRLAIAWGQTSIGDPVLLHAGVRIPHGQVVIDGFCEIETGVRVRPFATIGLVDGVMKGPLLGHDVEVGTDAKVLGPVTIGSGATIGDNAVVIDDVATGASVGGVPARVTD